VTLLFIMGVLLVLAAIVLVAMAVGKPQPQGMHRSLAVLEAMSTAPSELTKDLDKPFGERILVPLQAKALSVGKRFTGADSTSRIQHKLDLAGNPPKWNPDRVIAFKVIGAVVGLSVGFLITQLLGSGASTRILGSGLGLFIGFMAPNLYLYQTAYDRAAKMQRELPDAIDLMTISVESGLGFDAAVQQVANNTEGPLAEEFARTFVSAMVQADAFGIPIAQVLRVQSSEIRVKRRQRAEEKAQQVPVKITIPLIFTILPCLFIAVMGPAAISIMGNLG
jgi:tight adherence protein C